MAESIVIAVTVGTVLWLVTFAGEKLICAWLGSDPDGASSIKGLKLPDGTVQVTYQEAVKFIESWTDTPIVIVDQVH